MTSRPPTPVQCGFAATEGLYCNLDYGHAGDHRPRSPEYFSRFASATAYINFVEQRLTEALNAGRQYVRDNTVAIAPDERQCESTARDQRGGLHRCRRPRGHPVVSLTDSGRTFDVNGLHCSDPLEESGEFRRMSWGDR